jgi:hypothetical protein
MFDRVRVPDCARMNRVLGQVMICSAPFAFAGGSWIFLAFVVVALLAVVFGYYTYTGSGINAHPSKGGSEGSAGASGPSSASGKGRTPDDSRIGDGEGGAFDSHGTR